MWQRFKNSFHSPAHMRDFFLMVVATVLGTITVIVCVVVLVTL